FPGFSIIIFLIKVALFLFLFIWLRATLPRIRYDRLMRLGWQTLLPLAVLNVVITAATVALGLPWWVSGILGLAVVIGLLYYIRRQSVVEGTRFTETTEDGHEKFSLPSSVHFAKFEKVNPPTLVVPEAKEEQVGV
ncbi:MAG TPA: NADH-quinone oxidoreductase subunit H, partial [Ktedonobacter sp.]|nr:NADH-quinone oxidoreductase subunit H [Ktedonobacter sp.]